MASASDHRAHAALQPADCLILLPQRLPAAVETSIGPAHYPAECTQSDAFVQPSLRARYGRANSNSMGADCTREDFCRPDQISLKSLLIALRALLAQPTAILDRQSGRRSDAAANRKPTDRHLVLR